jgi:putative aldouronate transport system substrate-binding protein
MKSSKRLLALVLLTVFAFTAVLTGCGDKSADTGVQDKSTVADDSAAAADTTAAEPEQYAVDVASLKPYQIDWYFVGGSEPSGLKDVEGAINDYLKDKINATVKFYIPDWGTYQEKVGAMIMAGQKFDICFTANWWLNYTLYAQDGAFVDLDQYLGKELKPTWDALTTRLGKEYLDGSKINGKNYGIPSAKEIARHWGFVYNKNLADKYSFDFSSVKKFEDIEPFLKIIKEKEPDTVVPLFKDNNMNTGFISWNALNPDAIGVYKDGKWINQYETPEYKQAYDLMYDWYKKGYLQKDVATAKDGPTVRSTGNFFVFPVNLKPGYAAEQQSTIKVPIDQIDVTEPVITNNETMGSLQAISKSSKDPQRAAMFLNLVNTDPTLINLIAYGIEGKHYKKINDTTIEPIPDSGYGPDNVWKFGNQYLLKLLNTENPNKFQNFEDYNNRAKPVEELGFIFDNAPVMSEVAATTGIITEYHQVLKVGAVDPSVKLPEFIEKLQAAGSQTILDEMNKQWEAYKAAEK